MGLCTSRSEAVKTFTIENLLGVLSMLQCLSCMFISTLLFLYALRSHLNVLTLMASAVLRYHKLGNSHIYTLLASGTHQLLAIMTGSLIPRHWLEVVNSMCWDVAALLYVFQFHLQQAILHRCIIIVSQSPIVGVKSIELLGMLQPSCTTDHLDLVCVQDVDRALMSSNQSEQRDCGHVLFEHFCT